jgi:hypothetical protein
MLAKQTPKPFMVDRLVGALPELRQNAAIPVIRVISNNLANLRHEPLVVFAGAVGSAFPIGRR